MFYNKLHFLAFFLVTQSIFSYNLNNLSHRCYKLISCAVANAHYLLAAPPIFRYAIDRNNTSDPIDADVLAFIETELEKAGLKYKNIRIKVVDMPFDYASGFNTIFINNRYLFQPQKAS